MFHIDPFVVGIDVAFAVDQSTRSWTWDLRAADLEVASLAMAAIVDDVAVIKTF